MSQISGPTLAGTAKLLQVAALTATVVGIFAPACAWGGEPDPECSWSPASRIKAAVCRDDPGKVGAEPGSASSLIPKIDVEASCETHVRSGTQHDREIRRNYCLRGEQRAYDHLKMIEHNLDAKIIADCGYAFKMGSFQYQALEQCASAHLINRRDQREMNTRPPPFRY